MSESENVENESIISEEGIIEEITEDVETITGLTKVKEPLLDLAKIHLLLNRLLYRIIALESMGGVGGEGFEEGEIPSSFSQLLADLQTQVDELETLSNKLQLQITSNFNYCNNSITNLRTKLTSDIVNVQNNVNIVKLHCDSTNAELQEKIEDLKNQIENIEAGGGSSKEIEKAIQDLQDKVNKIETDGGATNEDTQRALDSLNDQITKVNNNIIKINNDITTNKADIQNKINQLTLKLNSVVTTEDYNSTISSLDARIKELEDKNILNSGEYEKSILELKEKLEILEKDRESTKEYYTNTITSLTEKITEIEKVTEDSNTDIDKEIARLAEQIANLEISTAGSSNMITRMDNPTDEELYQKAETMNNFGLIIVSRPDKD